MTGDKPYKAVFAGLSAFVGSLAVAATSPGLTLAEWLVATGVGLTAASGVYGISNGSPGIQDEIDAGISGGASTAWTDAEDDPRPSPHPHD